MCFSVLETVLSSKFSLGKRLPGEETDWDSNVQLQLRGHYIMLLSNYAIYPKYNKSTEKPRNTVLFVMTRADIQHRKHKHRRSCSGCAARNRFSCAKYVEPRQQQQKQTSPVARGAPPPPYPNFTTGFPWPSRSARSSWGVTLRLVSVYILLGNSFGIWSVFGDASGLFLLERQFAADRHHAQFSPSVRMCKIWHLQHHS